MEHHLVRNLIRRSKRHLNMNELFSSHHGKQPRLYKQEAFNQNRSLSPIHVHQRFERKNIYSSSYTSLNSYLKEFNLSEKDFLELRQAFKTIFHYLQSNLICDDDQSSLPLYTNEYFIRNGLLNHNDGPEIYDNTFQCYSHHSKPIIHLKSSSVNISLPLTLLSNQKYLFSALTSNFTIEKSRCSQSSMELNLFKYQGKDNDENETKSMIIRRNKVQTWKRENILAYSSIQENDQIEASESHRSSIVRTPSTNKDEKTIKIIEESIAENNSSLRTYNDLFPMVKLLAPYIIIPDSFQLNPNKNYSLEKRSLNDVLHPALKTAEHQSVLLSSASIMNQTRQINNEEQVYQRKKNYLLAEFESVLTQISEK